MKAGIFGHCTWAKGTAAAKTAADMRTGPPAICQSRRTAGAVDRKVLDSYTSPGTWGTLSISMDRTAPTRFFGLRKLYYNKQVYGFARGFAILTKRLSRSGVVTISIYVSLS